MCGIAGIVTTGPSPDRVLLAHLAKALEHRGPDGHDIFVSGNVGLAHARLAIIDLATGDQPLFGPEPGTTVLVANGEIYNDLALRRELGPERFRTGSDCEPPLLLYPRDDLDFPKALRGMYAIALADPDKGRVILTRDPFGIKPLYYAETEDGVIFASEPQVLIEAGLIEPQLDEAKRDEFLQLQFCTGTETPFEGIRRLAPGETLDIRQGHVVESRRLDPLDRPLAAPFRSEEEALAALDAALADSVEVHQRADVPFGMFLSGGVDSSVVLALMTRLNERPVLAFTAGFPGTDAPDERAHARAVAEACGAEHIEVEVTEADFWQHLPAIVASMDDPVADYAIVPTWLLAREARKSVKMVLSGEGGDEMFAGYGRYRAALRPWPFGKPMRRKGIFDGLGVLRESVAGWRAGYAQAEAKAKARFPDRLMRAQAADIAEWLPNDLLIKLDRCLMAHGVEGRVPFLDPAVVDVALRMPKALKIQDGMGKWILRKWLERHLPAARPFAPKQGFTVPVGEWINRRGGEIGALVAASPGVAEIAKPEVVKGLFQAEGKRERFAAWSLLFLALWHRRHILGQAVDGDVAEVLSAKA